MNCSIKTGMVHHVSVKTKDGIPKYSKGPFCNDILNNSVSAFMDGFPSLPIPDLGSSSLPVEVTQIGVQSPIPTSRKVILQPSELFNSESLEGANLFQWIQTYEYTYSGDGDFLREIAIPNFSRALITDIEGTGVEIELKGGDIVTLVTVFSLVLQDGTGELEITNPYIENPTQLSVPFIANGVSGFIGNDWFSLFKNMTVRAVTPAGIVSGQLAKGIETRGFHVDALMVNSEAEEVSSLIIGNGLSNDFFTINFPTPVEFIATQEPKFRILINW